MDSDRIGAASQFAGYPRRPAVPWTDIVLLLLAVGSLLMIGWMALFSSAPARDRIVVSAGSAVVTVVAGVFMW
jgi:hypothetical protein